MRPNLTPQPDESTPCAPLCASEGANAPKRVADPEGLRTQIPAGNNDPGFNPTIAAIVGLNDGLVTSAMYDVDDLLAWLNEQGYWAACMSSRNEGDHDIYVDLGRYGDMDAIDTFEAPTSLLGALELAVRFVAKETP